MKPFAAAIPLVLLTACGVPPAEGARPLASAPPAFEEVSRRVPQAEPAFSKMAVDLTSVYAGAFDDDGRGTSDRTVLSPDGRSRAVVRMVDAEGEELQIEVSGAIGSGRFDYAAGPNMEMMWSPDSRAFFFTENDGGIVGGYELFAVRSEGGRLVSRDLTPVVARSYRPPGKCFDPERPNVAGLAWEEGSRRLVALAETPPHSNCDALGTFSAVTLDLKSLKVVGRMGQLEAKARYGDQLGVRALNADDACFTQPGSCNIPALHRTGNGQGG